MRWLLALLLVPSSLPAQGRPRARDLGVPFDGTPGPLDAITDVAGVTVGHSTIIRGQGKLVVGQGPVRTGVTAIFPRGATNGDPVFGGWFTLNGNGAMTGTTWLEESGFLAGPVMITNTHSVGVVRDAVIEWLVRKGFEFDWSLPIVAETWDGSLNDINGFHVTKQHAFAALDSARGGPVVEGSVGGGTGMICNQFKGGIGTASRRLPSGPGGVHDRCPRAMQLWLARPSLDRRRPRRSGDSRFDALLRLAAGHATRRPPLPRRRQGFHHHRDRHRRALAAASAQADRQARRPRRRPAGWDRRKSVG